MKLFHRFFLILLGFSLLPVLGMGVLMFSSRGAVQDNARLLHTRLAALTADSAERTVDQLNRSLAIVAELETSRGVERLEVQVLQRAAMADSSVVLLSMLDAAGREVRRMADPEVLPDAAPQDRSADPTVVQCRRSGHLTLGTPQVIGGVAMVPVAHPLTDGRVLYELYSLRSLQRRLSRMPKGGHGRILIVDGEGKPIPGVGDAPPSRDWVLPRAVSEDGWSDRLPSSEGPQVAASVKLPSVPWRAVSLQPRRDAYAESDAAAVQSAVLFVALFLLVGAAAYGLSQRLLTPISALVSGAERVASGDFSRPIPRLGWGELDRLGKTFNAMTDKLRHYHEIHVDEVLEEKAKVDALVRNIPEGVVLSGRDGAVVFANSMAERVLGARKVLTPELKDLVRRAAGGSKPSDGVLLELKSGSGPAAFFSCQAVPVSRERGEVGVLVLMRDVTMERELEKMKEEFLHSIVHDLRAPVGVINGMVYFVKKLSNLGEREKKYVSLAEEASRRLSELIANILDIAKFESGTMKLVRFGFLAESIPRSARDLSLIPGEQRGITIAVEAPGATDLVADRDLLERVVMNLVGNALKFTPSGGRITLGAAPVAGEVEFSVRDTGPGIPADKLAEVFEKFKQLDRDAAAHAGYGLGLSICKKIVELHGGRIWVESVEGQGSRFVFRVPRG